MQRLLDTIAVLADLTLGERVPTKEEKQDLLNQIQVRLSLLREENSLYFNNLTFSVPPESMLRYHEEFDKRVDQRIAQLQCQPTNSNAQPVTSPLTSSTI